MLENFKFPHTSPPAATDGREFSWEENFIPLPDGLTDHLKIDPQGNQAFKSFIYSQSFYTVTQDEVKDLYLNMN